MQISRNNYEEYFLLYIDGELSKTDRNAVEQFVMLHPDLAEELELLKESMLLVDEMIQMPGKDQLLKQVEWKEEDITPLREELLLYVDNELDNTRSLKLEAQLAKDSNLNNELLSLAKAKLTAEPVEMSSKEKLYRSEKDWKPVSIRWTRWIAAAAAILGIGWFSLSVITKQQITTGELAGKPSTERLTPLTVPSNEATQNKEQQITQPVDESKTVEYAVVDTDPKNNPAFINTAESAQTATVRRTTATPDERDLLQNMSNQIAMVLPPTGVEDGKHDHLDNIATPNVDANVLANNPAVQQNKPVDNSQASPYQYASYDEIQEEESPYVNIAGARISKQKLRGVFRSVTRTVTRTFDKSTVSEADVSSL